MSQISNHLEGYSVSIHINTAQNVIEKNVVLHSEMGVVIMDQDTLLQKGVQIYPSTLYINQEGEVITQIAFAFLKLVDGSHHILSLEKM